MIFEHWTGQDTEALIHADDHELQAVVIKGMTRHCEIEAASYDEGMRLYHEHMGWEPYKPMKPMEQL